MQQDDKKHKLPDWLQKIQDNSSELELLISGGAIYALSQASKYINELSLDIHLAYGIEFMSELLIFIQVAVSVLFIGFVLHLVTRAYWLSLVCINYVYKKGVKYENLNMKFPFRYTQNKRPDLYKQILTADNLCGLIMLCLYTLNNGFNKDVNIPID